MKFPTVFLKYRVEKQFYLFFHRFPAYFVVFCYALRNLHACLLVSIITRSNDGLFIDILNWPENHGYIKMKISKKRDSIEEIKSQTMSLIRMRIVI